MSLRACRGGSVLGGEGPPRGRRSRQKDVTAHGDAAHAVLVATPVSPLAALRPAGALPPRFCDGVVQLGSRS